MPLLVMVRGVALGVSDTKSKGVINFAFILSEFMAMKGGDKVGSYKKKQ